MATAQVVITSPNKDTPAVGGLFAGRKFFLVQRLPSRSSFVQKIEANGGRIVKLEGQADHVIADHFRKDCPAGSLSYTFIDAAIRDEELPNPDDHEAGPPQGTIREAGSAIPGKNTRTPFTAEDDRVLWQWVERCKSEGALVKGNEIYKQLESRNDRHTFQAWRDRYIKKLMDKPPAGVELKVAANAPPSPPMVQDEQGRLSNSEFTEEHRELLMAHARDIEIIAPDQMDDAWAAWAQAYPEHSAQSWRAFWQESVRSVYLQSKESDSESEGQQIAQLEPESTDDSNHEDTSPSDDANEQVIEMPKAVLERPTSSGSQKRKRKSPLSSVNENYSHKKPKSHEEYSLEQDESIAEVAAMSRLVTKRSPAKPSRQPIELISSDDEDQEAAEPTLPTSDLNRGAQKQLEREGQEIVDDVRLTSDLNADSQAEAQAQFDEEVFGIPRSGARVDDHSMPNFPTSEVNLAADQQLRHESVDREDEMEVEKTSDLPQSADLPSPGPNDASRSQMPKDGSVHALAPKGDALTEANLASQQAEHKAQLLRGADLPEDDEVEDGDMQGKYIQFLQGVTRQPEHVQTLPTDTFKQQREAEAYGTAVPSNRWHVDQGDLGPEHAEELPISSQHEIEVAIDDIIQWPESPTMPLQKGIASEFETQVPYPDLPLQHAVPSQQQAANMFSSQASLSSQVAYPSLPQRPLEPPDIREGQVDEEFISSQPPASSQPQSIEESSSYVFVQDGLHTQSSQEERGEDEIDLSIPAPDGGWEASSSPSKMLNSSPTHQPRSQQHVMIAPNPDLSEDSEGDGETVEHDLDLADVTSSSSSSSSSFDATSDRAVLASKSREDPKRALETQDIINAETQQPDFDMPLPPDSNEKSDDLSSASSHHPSSSPNAAMIESQRTLAHTQTLPDDGLGTYIDTMVLRGYKESSVIAALKRTSMRPDLAELVLLDEKSGKGLPKDIAGIWSEDEDQIVESGNARGLRKLDEKHTWKEVEERMLFLQTWREEE